VGSHLIQENMATLTDRNRKEILEKTKGQVFDLLKDTIPPEFLNRIDDVIMFTPLTKDEIKEIVRLQFGRIAARLRENEIEASLSDDAIQWIADKGYDPQFGARPIKRLLEKNIVSELSKAILDGSVTKETSILIDCKKDTLVFKNQGGDPRPPRIS
jgi:ATP-dependent Clp protease ATP-binding subunit ClpB